MGNGTKEEGRTMGERQADQGGHDAAYVIRQKKLHPGGGGGVGL